MLKCSYIIYIHNDERTIAKLIESLQKINGNFLREYIFIDDGSTDSSLQILKKSSVLLAKVTIISHNNLGPAISINKALGLVDGDYIHFVHGTEMLQPNSTERLIECCEIKNTSVAIGLNVVTSAFETIQTSGKITVKQCPIKEVLSNSIAEARGVGLTGSVVKFSLLKKIGYTDELIYNHNMSLSLRCAAHSSFVFIDEIVSIIQVESVKAKTKEWENFERYNNLRAILNFIYQKQELCKIHRASLLFVLYKELPFARLGTKIMYYIGYVLAQFTNYRSLSEISRYYEQELLKLL